MKRDTKPEPATELDEQAEGEPSLEAPIGTEDEHWLRWYVACFQMLDQFGVILTLLSVACDRADALAGEPDETIRAVRTVAEYYDELCLIDRVTMEKNLRSLPMLLREPRTIH